MQDNSINNYDPELVDQGWSLLEKQLDEVLPQKPKRRFGWFWLPLLLAFTTLTGAGFYLASQGSSTDNPSPAPFSSEQNKQVIAQSDNTTTLEDPAKTAVHQTETTEIAVSEATSAFALSNAPSIRIIITKFLFYFLFSHTFI